MSKKNKNKSKKSKVEVILPDYNHYISRKALCGHLVKEESILSDPELDSCPDCTHMLDLMFPKTVLPSIDVKPGSDIVLMAGDEVLMLNPAGDGWIHLGTNEVPDYDDVKP